MRQIWTMQTGGPEVLALREAPDPEPPAGAVRIRVERSGVNFADILTRKGLYPDAPALPCVTGYEVAGTIDAVGAGVGEAWVGKHVLAFTRFGGYADVVCVAENQVLERPAAMSVDEAAAIPVNYITAYQLLVASGQVTARDSVLIHQAAGGVGLACLDLCRIFGSRTFGTASAAKHAFLYERGLDHAIDYTTADYAEAVMRLTGGKGVNLVLDPIGGDSWRKGWEILAPAGRLVMFGFSSATTSEHSLRRVIEGLLKTPWFKFNPLNLMNANKGVIGVNVGHLWHEADLLRGWTQRVLDWYAEGKIRPHVDRVFSFAEAAEAHRYIEERRNVGKVLLRP